MALPLVRTIRKSFDSIVDSQVSIDHEVALGIRERLLRRHGDFTLAYSACYQKGLNHFGDRNGFVTFGKKMGQTIVLGDPITGDHNKPELLTAFLSRYKNPVFCQINFETAKILSELGFRINAMGVDSILRLNDYNFNGKSKERFRYADNWLTKNGYRIRELTYAQLGRPRARRLSVQWRRTRNVRRREVAFLNRPLVYKDEPDVRNFYLFDPEDRLVAFNGFDPLYRENEIVGYVTTFKRRCPTAPAVAEHGMMKKIIDVFQSEKRQQVNLGLSPLADTQSSDLRSNPLLKFSFRYGFNSKWINRYYYNLKGHADYKRRFGGQQFQTYFASKKLLNDLPLIGTLRLCKVI